MAAPKGHKRPDLSEKLKGNQYAVGNKGQPPVFTSERIEQEALALLEWIQTDAEHKIYIGSFAKSRGYCRQRLSEFARDNKVFEDAYKLAKQWQEEKFIRNGLTRVWDSTFTARVMARVCGPEWKNSWDKEDDKKDQNINVTVNEYTLPKK